MSSSLSGIPAQRRKHVAAVLGLFAMLFIAVGAVSATASPSAATTAFTVVALAVAVLLALMAWGREGGGQTAWLQVFDANRVARELYESLGFRSAYPYHYRRRAL